MERLLAVLVLVGASVNAQNITNSFGSGTNGINLVFVKIGSPGNPNDPNCTLNGNYPANTVGGVSYSYNISKYEITQDSIAKANAQAQIGIILDNVVSSPNRPATGISWNEAARFVNYLNTNKGFPPAYKFSGTNPTSNIQVWLSTDDGYDASNPFRNKNAKFFLPRNNEWHKAAYYDPIQGRYFTYATGSDVKPTAVSSGTNSGTSVYSQGWSGPADVEYAGGTSPFGTVGQGGNVEEWLEDAFYTPGPLLNNDPSKNRVVRGDHFKDSGSVMNSDYATGWAPTSESQLRGFRVASTPERIFDITQTTNAPVTALNIALGASISVSSTYEDNVANFGPGKLIDGSSSETVGAFWLAKGTADSVSGTLPAWIVFDLGREYSMGVISILNIKNAPFNDRGAKSFYISISSDGVIYESISGARILDWQNTSFQNYQFPSNVVARFVKITLQDAYGGRGAVGLNEVKIFPALSAEYTLARIFDSSMGNISVSPDRSTYEPGAQVTLTANSNPGFRLNSWSGDGSGASNAITLTMNSDKAITANFEQDTADADSDGLSNYQEIVTYGTNPNQKDSNTDGIEDGQAVSLGYSPAFNFGALINFIKTNPPSGLYSQTQYESQRTNGQNDILNAPNSYNLYTTNQIHAMAIGDLVLTSTNNGSFVLNYDIEQSEDLVNWYPYQGFAMPLTNLPANKAFVRIKAKQASSSYTGSSQTTPTTDLNNPISGGGNGIGDGTYQPPGGAFDPSL